MNGKHALKRRASCSMLSEDTVTFADSKALEEDYDFRPEINIRTGLRNFAEWYKMYYK